MRTIKFRGKRVDNGEWVYGYYVSDTSHRGDWKNVIYGNDEFIPVVPETVGQFTGLLDKVGKEIYDGDNLIDKDGYIYRVKFQNGGFRYAESLKTMGRSKSHLSAQKIHNSELEVIGNIQCQ